MVFDPTASQLTCPYCGNQQAIPQAPNEIRELSYEAYFREGNLTAEVLENTALEVRCPGCGAVVEIAANVAMDNCVFCGTHLDNPGHSPVPAMRPQGVLPFAVDLRRARESFSGWAKSRWFAPNDLYKMALLGRLEGLYVPYWTYDAATFSFYSGMRGDHYWVTVRGPKGESRQERRTRWTPVSGRVQHFFDDVLVCASQGLPDKLVRELEPWSLEGVKPYTADYLAGYKTERYQVDVRQGFDHARPIMDAYIRTLIDRDIGGDVQQITSVETQYDGVTFKHLLLPIWLAAYRYQNTSYRVLVNAQTGEVSGERPYSWIKITLVVMLVAIIVLVIVVATQGHSGGGPVRVRYQ